MNPVDIHMTRAIVRWCAIVQVCISLMFIITQSARLAPVLAASPSGAQLFLVIRHALIPVWSWTLLPSFILAVFIVSGAMVAQGEQTALHGAGISPWRLSRQPLIIGGVFVAISAWMALSAVPAAQRKFKQALQQMVAGGIADTLVPGTFVQPTDDVLFFADGKDAEGRFQGVYMEYPEERAVRILVAESAEITLAAPRHRLNIAVRNGELFFAGNQLTVFSFEKLHLSLSLKKAVATRSDFLPETALASSHRLLRKTAAGKASRMESFEIHRRIAQPVGFALIAILSVVLAFLIPWQHRYAAMGAGIALFVLSQTLTRGAQAWLHAGILSPLSAATCPFLLLLLTAVVGYAGMALKNQLNSLCKNKVSCR
ncbi:MAG: LptF/LptG family permease [Deltaproteobacteria bacterium]|nr:LptF/LptG family permease [Deltaproteobacteria bacterium]